MVLIILMSMIIAKMEILMDMMMGTIVIIKDMMMMMLTTKVMVTMMMAMMFTWPSLAWIFCGWEAKITKDSPPSGLKSYVSF